MYTNGPPTYGRPLPLLPSVVVKLSAPPSTHTPLHSITNGARAPEYQVMCVK